MATSADIAILMKVADLVQRFGLRASDYEATTGYVDEDADPAGQGYSYLSFDSIPTDQEKYNKVMKIQNLLGVSGGTIKAEHQADLEDLLNEALSVAPRVRGR